MILTHHASYPMLGTNDQNTWYINCVYEIISDATWSSKCIPDHKALEWNAYNIVSIQHNKSTQNPSASNINQVIVMLTGEAIELAKHTIAT